MEPSGQSLVPEPQLLSCLSWVTPQSGPHRPAAYPGAWLLQAGIQPSVATALLMLMYQACDVDRGQGCVGLDRCEDGSLIDPGRDAAGSAFPELSKNRREWSFLSTTFPDPTETP